MELLLLAAILLILLQTTYLTTKSIQKTVTHRGDILVDTSVLIDGRILAIARSGLIGARLLVPQSVVRELQFMADKADHDKRERARYGLEIIEKLQQLPDITLIVSEDGETSEHGVDEQLIVLAKKSGAKLCTIDYNLNKAARVQDVEIININELAHALRVIHLPGEKIAVELVQAGQDKKQAVAYLDDGTMVVVDDARELIGQSVDVELTRVLQTAAGRMMFARRLHKQLRDSKSQSTSAEKRPHQAPQKTVQSRERRKPSKGPKSSEDTLVTLANE